MAGRKPMVEHPPALAALIVLLGTMRMRAAATRSQLVAPIVDGPAAARYGMDDFLQATATPGLVAARSQDEVSTAVAVRATRDNLLWLRRWLITLSRPAR